MFVIRLISMIMAFSVMSSTAVAQLGYLTSTVGTGQLVDTEGVERPWAIGTSVDEGDVITTGTDGYAMVFFASDMDFEGAIVVRVDRDSRVEVRRGTDWRQPIEIHVTAGGVKADFDAREHGAFILLSTPQGVMRVTGSTIVALYNEDAGSQFGTFDSSCEVTLDEGGKHEISRSRMIVVDATGTISQRPMTSTDKQRWQALPDFYEISAITSGALIRSASAEQAWVEAYVTSEATLEDVARQFLSNIPSQEALAQLQVAPVVRTILLAVIVTAAASEPELRAVRADRPVSFGAERDAEARRTGRPPIPTILTVPRDTIKVERDITRHARPRVRVGVAQDRVRRR